MTLRVKKSLKSKTLVKTPSQVHVTLRGEGSEFSKSTIWVERDNFYGNSHAESYIIVGFDTEFKTPEEPLDYSEIRAGGGKYKVLSYQVHCSVFDPAQPDAREWSGICYPNDGDSRLSLSDVLLFAFEKGIREGAVKTIPSKVYIAGHFTRADFPALADFQDLTELISSVRATFLSIDGHIPLEISFPNGETSSLKVVLRDTMLLTPANSKSLAALGDLVGQEKISLDPDLEKSRHYKSNMDLLLRDNPELFEKYAINDATICVRYLQQLIEQCEQTLGSRKVPATLTAIGVDLLMHSWKHDLQEDPLELLGQEQIEESYFSKKLNRYQKKRKIVNLQQVDWHVALATECYHGGRNEQFWFGPAFEDDWTDHDLSGAYPTAMALIGKPDWRNIRVTLEVSDFTPVTLGMARVHFEFPQSVRFPSLPVRTENGLIFPREGTSDCGAPEIALAAALGAKLKIEHGVVVPMNQRTPIFRDFIGDCIRKRYSHPKGSLRALFWKELSNSSYGKTAQGLRQKRVYDLRDREMKPLPPSKITNPFFASFITSFVRSTLGEVMNGLPENVCIFSCTTDGFLTNASDQQIEAASNGPIASEFRKSREALTGDATILEVKHRVRRPLGWRTRGQATLKQGETAQGDDVNIVLAKGGIFTPAHLDTDRLQNEHIVERFFAREPDHQIPLKVKTGIRDIVEFDADLVEKSLSKRLNMEYDWKRRPIAAWNDEEFGHVAFATEPWQTAEEFVIIRKFWEGFGIVAPRCLKSLADFEEFAVYVLSQSSLDQSDAKYLRKRSPDIARLRQMLCAAWRQSKGGLRHRVDGATAQKFADALSGAGIPCKRTDVENARKPLVENTCPNTPDVRAAFESLSLTFPNLNRAVFLSTGTGIDMIDATSVRCPYSSTAVDP